jgi:hypothetical protein
MELMAAMLDEGRPQARLDEAFSGNAWGREHKPLGRMTPSMTPGPSGRCFMSGIGGVKLRIGDHKRRFTSSWASICGRRDRAIRKKIIGHGMSVFPKGFPGGSVFHYLLRTLPLLHQPARQHGGGILLHPKIEKRADLFAEIGGMAETREFVALERVSRSREKKLPRRLGLVMVHWGLPESDESKLTLR